MASAELFSTMPCMKTEGEL